VLNAYNIYQVFLATADNEKAILNLMRLPELFFEHLVLS